MAKDDTSVTTLTESAPAGSKGRRPRKTDKHGREMSVRPVNDRAVARFVEHADVALLLDVLSGDDKYKLFLAAMHDPAQSNLSFSALMRRYNVSLHELQSIYIDAQRQIALLKMSNKLPKVLEDIASDAESKIIACARCDGIGTIPSGKRGKRTCPACNGNRRVRAPGDGTARQQMLETMKLVGRSSTNFVVNQNFGSAGELESELGLTQSIVMGDRR